NDVFIVWCGPNVRSRKITVEDLNDWTNRLKGRIPFLWDNTLYSHFPFTSTPLFSAWDNVLPIDFYKRTAGSGMFLNGNANAEDSRVAEITAIDYLWDPENYNPEKSLSTAMENYYGKSAVKLLFDFKEAELNLRKKIGERKLWFEADTLWTIIRKTRFITDKNPEYYQQNYNRLKALRLQLKYSVPEPGSKEEFIKECTQLNKKRNEIITQLSRMDKSLAERIKAIMMLLPDFNSIQ
ncbi:MAG: beta-N-acetylglucosaminidase domain-containing protein, partial [Ignavibacteriaceae bacterium]